MGGFVSMCWCVCVVLCCVVLCCVVLCCVVCCVVLCCVVLCCVCCVCVVVLVVSLKTKWSSTASSGKANDWRTRKRVVLDLFSNLEWVRTKGFFR